MMQNIWRLQGKVVFNEVSDNLFMVKFQETLDLQWIQNGKTWTLIKIYYVSQIMIGMYLHTRLISRGNDVGSISQSPFRDDELGLW